MVKSVISPTLYLFHVKIPKLSLGLPDQMVVRSMAWYTDHRYEQILFYFFCPNPISSCWWVALWSASYLPTADFLTPYSPSSGLCLNPYINNNGHPILDLQKGHLTKYILLFNYYSIEILHSKSTPSYLMSQKWVPTSNIYFISIFSSYLYLMSFNV